MPFLSDEDQRVLREKFSEEMQKDIRLLFFTRRASALFIPGQPQRQQDAQLLRQAEELMREIASLSSRLTLEVYDIQSDAAVARSYGVDKVPALMLEADGTALRFFGLPLGYEFSTFVQDVLDLSTGHIELAPETQDYLKHLAQDVHLQVFVTPTCPYCPAAAWMAHQMMMVNPARVRADVVEANEFPEYSQRYQVSAVPRVVINDRVYFEGALPEGAFLEAIRSALDAAPA